MHIIVALIIDEPRAGEEIQRGPGAGQRTAERLLRPEGFVEDFLDAMLRLVEVHGEFLLDDAALLVNFRRVELRVKEHVGEDVEQFIKPVVAGLGVITGHLLAGEGVEIAADALHILRNLPRRAPFGALEEQMLDEMADAVDFRRFIAAADAHPEPEADARHVRHFRRGDGDSVFKPGYLIVRDVFTRFHKMNTSIYANALGMTSGGPTRRS